MISVLLVDDHELIRIAIANVLSGNDDISVVGEAGDGEEALVQARKLKPDVVLIDVDMPGMGGVEATKRLTSLPGDPKVVVLSVHSQAPYPQRLLEAGAKGYLPKGAKSDEVLAAVRSVAKGSVYIAPEIAGELLTAGLSSTGKSPLEVLSKREMQIMMMLTEGKSPNSIAESLNISPKTVFTHRYRIYEKLAVDSDVALTRLAMRHGMLEGFSS